VTKAESSAETREADLILRSKDHPLITSKSLAADLKRMGIRPGMTILVHSSLSSIGLGVWRGAGGYSSSGTSSWRRRNSRDADVFRRPIRTILLEASGSSRRVVAVDSRRVPSLHARSYSNSSDRRNTGMFSKTERNKK
jgi:hypothetical protein